MSDIEVLEREIDALRRQLNEKQRELSALRSAARVQQSPAIGSTEKLSNDEIERYARQIILPEIGVRGQLALKNASVLIIGAGGLGMLQPSNLHSSLNRSSFWPCFLFLFRLSIGTIFVWRRCWSHWHR